MNITSRDNSLLRHARAVRDGKVTDLVFVEGLRLCEEALRSELSIEAVIYSTELARKEKALETIEQLIMVARRSGTVSEKLLESISYTKTSQGIIVLAKRPSSGPELFLAAVSNQSLIVVMHQLNNPVNVGPIIRTAEAAGVAGVIATLNTTNPFSPKALRGAMGSAFRLPIWMGVSYAAMIEWCAKNGLATICADAEAPLPYTEFDWTKGTALILGPESTGLSQEEVKAAQYSVRIPMHGMVESLNVSVAAGVLLFEAQRQRRGK